MRPARFARSDGDAGRPAGRVCSLVLAILCLVPGFAFAQTVGRKTGAFDHHVRAVRAERQDAFVAAWEAAPQVARRVAADFLIEHRRGGAPLGTPPSFAALGTATRLLAGELREDATSALARCADALDLMVTPGAFSVRDTGRGEPLTVRVYRLYEVEVPDCDVRLFWRAPSGAERLARRAPVAQDAFGAEGFELYVRAPLAEPGVWELVLELEDDGARARALAVRVECVADLGERAAAAGRVAAATTEDRVLQAEAGALLDFGLRAARGPRLDAELQRLTNADEPVADEPDAGPWPVVSAAGHVGWSLDGRAGQTGAGAREPRALLLFARPSQEAIDGVFAPRSRARLEAALGDCPALSVAFDPAEGATLEGWIAAGRAAFPSLPVVLVLRGDALTRAAFALLGGAQLPVDGLVLATEAPRPLAGFPRVPTLFLSTNLATGLETREGLELVRWTPPAIVAELDLARRIDAWLTANAEALVRER